MLWGCPLLVVACGPDAAHDEDRGIARGIIAIGDIAVGVVAIGGLTAGVISIGGLSCGVVTIGGVALGGIVLGVSESLAAGFISSAYKDVIAFMVMIVVLLFRPEGLLGKR